MMTQHDHWHPTWYKPEYSTSWGRVKEAVRRDWQQTKHDLHVGGHELNQQVADTVKQAAGSKAIPSINSANPPKVIGDLPVEWQTGEWERVESPFEYGYVARCHFGATYLEWNDDLDRVLRKEWEAAAARREPGLWDDVKSYVRRGYDHKS